MFTTLPVIPTPPSGLRESKKHKPQPYTIELQWGRNFNNLETYSTMYNVHAIGYFMSVNEICSFNYPQLKL